MGICELMTTSASDSNAVSDKTKHDQAKPPRHSICARFKDTRHKCAYDFEDLGIIGELITMSSLMLWQFVSLKVTKILWRVGFSLSCLNLSTTALVSNADIIISSQMLTASKKGYY